MVFQISEEVRPLSECHGGVAELARDIRQSPRPLVLTDEDEPIAVLMDASLYLELKDRIGLLESIIVSGEQLAAGQGIPNEEARERVLKSIRS